MHRQPLLAMIEDYRRRFPEEREVAEQIRALVTGATDCFERTCRPGHVTGSAWVVNPARTGCLLVHHRKLNKWLQPGGHADGETNVASVAMREAAEETGLASLCLVESCPLDLDVHVIPARYDSAGELTEDAHEHHDVRFLIEATDEETPTVSHESYDVRWFNEQELRDVTGEESVLRLWRKGTK